MLSSVSATQSSPARPRPWIVSAWWDLTYVVITPVAIVPVVLILAQHYLTAEQLLLVVIAFASLGHHLPGFMRAYGDRDLFLRFRWRFLLVPPLVFCLALLFTPPRAMAELFHLPWTHLHGLELILLIWGTWHGLMQTYGFMRIYDVKLGVNDRWSARLDHWLCVMVFVAGVVFSDSRVFGIAQAMWQSGLPLFGPESLFTLRYLVAATGLFVLLLYAINLFNRWKSGQPISWLKLWLVGMTGWFFWYTGRLSTNLLIGLAMFEIYHAVQYYAIVWVYNRRLFERSRGRFGPLGFLFRDRLTMLCVYLAAIAAYSSIRLLNVDARGLIFQGSSQEAGQWLMAFFVTSSFLHFYFDGFIWQVSERKTQEILVDNVPDSLPLTHFVPGLVHVAKWALLLSVAGGLLYSEWRNRDEWNIMTSQRLAALVRLTPSLPESQMLLSQQALAAGDPQAAVQHARQAVELRPRSHSMHAILGTAFAEIGRVTEARRELELAISIAPEVARYHTQLAQLLVRTGELDLAEQEYLRAIELDPEAEMPRQALVEFYVSQNRTEEAASELEKLALDFPNSDLTEIFKVYVMTQQGKSTEAVQLATMLLAGSPDDWRVQQALGTALNGAGEYTEAQRYLLEALQSNRNTAEIYAQLGSAHFETERFSDAIEFLQVAHRMRPHDFRVALLLGRSYLYEGKLRAGVEALKTASSLQPEDSSLYSEIGAVLAALGQFQDAKDTYHRGLDVDPRSAALHYNLGLLHHHLNEIDQARYHVDQAEELGLTIPPKLKISLGNNQDQAGEN